MAGSIAKAYVQVIPSAQGIKGKLSSMLGGEASAAGESAGGSFVSGLLSKAKGLLAAAGIGKLLGDSLMSGGALQQSLGGVETLFKDSADTVIANAERAYQTAGMSANQYMETVTGFSASLLQGMSGDTAKAAAVADMAMTDMSDNANKMGTSMEAIQNAYQGFAKQNYTMLDNLKLGYGGTKTEMERLLKDAEKISGVKYDISNLADVYSAIHVIQGEMEISGRTAEDVAEIYKNTGRVVKESLGTTAKEAAITLSGSLASMKASFSNVLANLSLGRDVGPALSALGDTVKTFLVGNLLPMVDNILQQLPMVISSAISIAGGALAELPTMFSNVLSAVVRSINGIGDNADAILQMGLDFVLGMGQAIITAAPYLAEAAFNLVMAFGEAILTTDWMQIATDTVTGISDGMAVAAGEIFGSDGNILQAIMDNLSLGLPGFLETGIGIVTNIVSGIVGMVPGLLETGTGILTSFVGQLMANFPTVLAAGSEIVNVLMSGVTALLPTVIASALELLTMFLDQIMTNLPMALSTGTEVVNTLVNGVLEMLPKVVTSALTTLTTFVNQLIASLPDVLSAGQTILTNLVDGIRQTLPEVLASAGEAVGTMLTGIVENLPSIIAAGFDLVVSLITGLGNAKADLFAGSVELLGKVWEAVESIDWWQVGSDIVNGLINGIGAMAGALWSAAQNIARSALNAIKSFLGIASPSKVMRDQVGKWIPSGVAVGIEANTKPLKDAMHNMSDLTTDSLQTDLQLANTFRSWPGASAGAKSFEISRSAEDSIAELVGDIEEGMVALLNDNNALLRELLETVLGIRVGDEVIGRAVDRYNRRKNIINGGLV